MAKKEENDKANQIFREADLYKWTWRREGIQAEDKFEGGRKYQ